MKVKELIQEKVNELLEYLQEAPVDLSTVIYHDKLYELAASTVIDDLASEAEARADEHKLKDYND